jgi:hypothetical protein
MLFHQPDFLSKSFNYLKFSGLKLSIVFLFIFLAACHKDKTTDPPVTTVPTIAKGQMVLAFTAKVDTARLVFNKPYLNANADTFSVSKFNYFISNVVITKSDNTLYTENESYHLIRHASGSTFSLTLTNVPVADYKSISFMIGVDSTRNVSGTQSGDLDPANVSDMFWSWNTGYIFLKLEGSSPKVPSGDKKFQFHIGGYGGVNKTQRSVGLSFVNTPASVKESGMPVLQIGVNVNEIFANPTKVDLKSQYTILNQGANAKMVADNYADMMQLTSVQNN